MENHLPAISDLENVYSLQISEIILAHVKLVMMLTYTVFLLNRAKSMGALLYEIRPVTPNKLSAIDGSSINVAAGEKKFF